MLVVTNNLATSRLSNDFTSIPHLHLPFLTICLLMMMGGSPHKGEIAFDLLLHNQLPIHILHGSLGFLVGGELDQGVAFDIARPVIQRHTEVFDGPKVGKLVVQVLLGALLVQARDKNDPSLDGYRNMDKMNKGRLTFLCFADIVSFENFKCGDTIKVVLAYVKR